MHASVRAFTITVLASCALACTSPLETGYLDDYARLRPGRYLDASWCDPGADFAARFGSVRIGSVTGRELVDHPQLSADDAVDFLRRELELAGAEHGGDDVLIDFARTGPALRLDVALTEMDPGSSSGRFWAGSLGAGNAYVQVETRLVDPADERVLCELVQRSRSTGGWGTQDIVGDPSAQLVMSMLRGAARAMRKELLAKLDG